MPPLDDRVVLLSAILKLGVSSRTALVRMLAPGEAAAIRRRGEEVVCGTSAAAGARLVGLEPRIPEASANLDAATFRLASEDFLALTFSATAAGLGVLTESEQQLASELFARQVLSRHRPDSRHLAIHDRQPGAVHLPEAEGPLAPGAGDHRFLRKDGEPRPGLKRERSLLASRAAHIARIANGGTAVGKMTIVRREPYCYTEIITWQREIAHGERAPETKTKETLHDEYQA